MLSIRLHTQNGLRLGRSPLFMIIALTLPVSLALLAGCGGEPPVEMPSSPHPIIIIDLDSVRADHLGCYGYQRDTSPNIDALAAEAVRFEWAFAQAPSTAPSQASILTGLYPTTHGVVDETTRLPDQAETLAEALSGAAYTTAAFVDGGYLTADLGFSQGFDVFDNSHGEGIDEIGPKALTWLRQHADDTFLMLVHTYDAHAPFDPPAENRLFLEGLEPPSEGFAATPDQIEAIRRDLADGNPDAMPPGDLEYTRALYDGEIRHVDAWVGKLMSTLRELGLDRRATVVVISDHGQELLEHHDLMHDMLHTTVTRVPFLLRLPSGQHPAALAHYVETVDLVPTLLDLAGVPVPHMVQGKSLVPMVLGQSRPPYVAFSESPRLGGQRAVALSGYRLIVTGGATGTETGAKAEAGNGAGILATALFNLDTDPLELADLSSDEPDRVDALMLRLDDWTSTVRNTVITAEESDVNQDTLEQLKGLGYIQ